MSDIEGPQLSEKARALLLDVWNGCDASQEVGGQIVLRCPRSAHPQRSGGAISHETVDELMMGNLAEYVGETCPRTIRLTILGNGYFT